VAESDTKRVHVSEADEEAGSPMDESSENPEIFIMRPYHLKEEQGGAILVDDPITDDVVIALLKSEEIFHILDLSGCNHITDALLHQIPILRPDLKELRLDHCKGLTFRTIIDLPKIMPNLELLKATPMVAGKSVREALMKIRHPQTNE